MRSILGPICSAKAMASNQPEYWEYLIDLSATLAPAIGLQRTLIIEADNYLNRVPRARILEAVREAKGEKTAQLLDHLKKGEMATEAEASQAFYDTAAGLIDSPLAHEAAIRPTDGRVGFRRETAAAGSGQRRWHWMSRPARRMTS